MDSQRDTFFVFNPFTGDALRWNKAFKENSGYTDKEIATQKAPESYYSIEDIEKANEYIQKLLSGGSGTVDLDLIAKDGTRIPTEYSASLIRDKDGEPNYIISTGRDVRERKKTEKEKLNLLADLRQSQKMEAIGTMAGGIAHDFNNILGATLGFAELAKVDIQKGLKPVDDLDEIIKSAHRAKELVKQILTYSRKETHKLEPLNPQSIIKESLKLLRATLPANIEIREDIEGENNSILADPTKIQQIIINLCTNALHSMEETGGVLTVTLAHKNLQESDLPLNSNTSPGEFLKLVVSDTGQGLDKKTIDRIFDPYFTTKEVGKGTGLGLSVIDGIVKDYKGFIEVDSTPGKGSSFNVYLPISQEASILKDSTPVGIKEFSSPANKHILIVDDELLLVKVNKRRLENLGYKVTATTDSKDALEKVREQKEQFDLIITDQTMPGLTGADLAQEVLKLHPDMPIIMCTGHSDIISERDALALGIKKYIFKPIQGDELVNAVREVLNVK